MLKLNSSRRNNSAGDTIIEVMLSMSIIAMVLGASYSIATRSLRMGRQAQERIEALKLIEGQIEKLKFISAEPNFDWASVGPYCVKPDNSLSAGSIAGFNAGNVDQDNFAGYVSVGCQYGSRYNMSIQHNTTNDTFTVMARWERLGGGRDEAVIYYRMHQ